MLSGQTRHQSQRHPWEEPGSGFPTNEAGAWPSSRQQRTDRRAAHQMRWAAETRLLLPERK